MRSDRCAALEAILRADGVTASVTEAGPDGELAVVRGAGPATVAAFAARARALGFRYVTVDLATLPDVPT